VDASARDPMLTLKKHSILPTPCAVAESTVKKIKGVAAGACRGIAAPVEPRHHLMRTVLMLIGDAGLEDFRRTQLLQCRTLQKFSHTNDVIFLTHTPVDRLTSWCEQDSSFFLKTSSFSSPLPCPDR